MRQSECNCVAPIPLNTNSFSEARHRAPSSFHFHHPPRPLLSHGNLLTESASADCESLNFFSSHLLSVKHPFSFLITPLSRALSSPLARSVSPSLLIHLPFLFLPPSSLLLVFSCLSSFIHHSLPLCLLVFLSSPFVLSLPIFPSFSFHPFLPFPLSFLLLFTFRYFFPVFPSLFSTLFQSPSFPLSIPRPPAERTTKRGKAKSRVAIPRDT